MWTEWTNLFYDIRDQQKCESHSILKKCDTKNI
jgi:hypothetical protein